MTSCFYTVGSSLIDWFCRKQVGGVIQAGGVSRSSMAAESRAVADAAAGGIFVRDLALELNALAEIGLTVKTTEILCDSQSTIQVLQDVFACKRSKSFITDVKAVRDWVLRLVYRFVKIRTDLHLPDMLTKPLAVGPFLKHRESILSASIVVPTSDAMTVSSYFIASEVCDAPSSSSFYALAAYVVCADGDASAWGGDTTPS